MAVAPHGVVDVTTEIFVLTLWYPDSSLWSGSVWSTRPVGKIAQAGFDVDEAVKATVCDGQERQRDLVPCGS